MIGYRHSTIANKILLGFFPLIVLLGVIPFYVLVNLNKLTELNQQLVQEDIFVIELIDNIFNELLLQESFGQHYLISQAEEIKQHFNEHGHNFSTRLSQLKAKANNPELLSKIAELLDHYHRYNILYLTRYQASETLFAENTALNNQKISAQFDQLSCTINGLKQSATKQQHSRVRQVAAISNRAFKVMAGLAIAGILTGVGSAFWAFRYIIRSIKQLVRATEEIASGNFYFVPEIKGTGEMKTLAKSFSDMGHRLAELEKRNLDTNSLTRLPSGLKIETVLKERLNKFVPTAFCLIDADNFKAFNDRYGYAAGNRIIKMIAEIIREKTLNYGTGDDFVGHIGGDDFVIITVPEKYKQICQAVIAEFDTRVRQFYTPKDLERGYIESTSRQGEEMQFPIMSLSIAVVANSGKKRCNYIRFSEIAAELKSKAKILNGSVCVVDQRRDT